MSSISSTFWFVTTGWELGQYDIVRDDNECIWVHTYRSDQFLVGVNWEKGGLIRLLLPIPFGL